MQSKSTLKTLLWHNDLHKMFKTFSMVVLVSFMSFLYGQQPVHLTTGTSWKVPCGVTKIKVEAWGGGGSGGSRGNKNPSGAPGGGGAAYFTIELDTQPGVEYIYLIGKGGVARPDASTKDTDGKATTFTVPDSGTLTANGGQGTQFDATVNPTTFGNGGTKITTTPTFGAQFFSADGGKGGNAVGANPSGGGGGAGSAAGTGGTNNVGDPGTSSGYGGWGAIGVYDGNGNSGSKYGGGGSGAYKKSTNTGASYAKIGGAGASGGIVITYIGFPQSSATSLTGNTIGCGISKSILTATGGNEGTGVSTLFYDGNIIPTFSYINEFNTEFTDPPTITTGTNVSAVTNGFRTFSANIANPQIAGWENVLKTPIDPAKQKFVTIRYQVISPKNTTNKFQIYFKKGEEAITANSISNEIITDGNWHIINIDMSQSSKWNNTGGTITGFQFGYASVSGSKINIDYFLLGDTPILENINANESLIAVEPSAIKASAEYGTLRISECNGWVVGTATPRVTIQNTDRTAKGTEVNWGSNNNWVQGVVPDETNCVKVPKDQSVKVNVKTAKAKNITVDNGGKITINALQTLTVNDGIINNGSFTIASDGNLLQLNPVAVNSGNIKAERNVQDMNNVTERMDYVYWSSPVTGQQIHDGTKSVFSPQTPKNRNYEYRESNDYFYATQDLAFKKGKGYAIRAEAGNILEFPNPYNKAYVFTGIPNNGNFESDETLKFSGPDHGYNLIGNPYPSNMDFDLFYEANSDKIEKVAYFWTNNTPTPMQSGSGYTGNSYAIYNGTGGTPATAAGGADSGFDVAEEPDGIVKLTQGFIVQAIAGGKDKKLVFANTMRKSAPGIFFEKANKDRFWLSFISPSNIVNTILIGYVTGATNGFDKNYDTPLFVESSDAVYSVLGSEKLGIQGRAPFTVEDKVYLGTTQFENGPYTLSLKKAEGIFGNSQPVYLKDHLTGIVTNLSESNYTFTANAGESSNRFQIMYETEKVLNVTDPTKDDLIVYRNGEEFIVKSTIKNISDIEVYDLSGRLYKKWTTKSKEVNLDLSSLNRGAYILRIVRDGQVINRKILK